LGFKPVPTVKSFYSNFFADTLQVMYIVPSQPTPHFEAMMNLMAQKLELAEKSSRTLGLLPN
jgi:hypothetical protein